MNLSEISFDTGELQEKLAELNPLKNNLYSICDEITFGRLFADSFRSIARYNSTSKCWYVYNGIIWEKDEAGVMVEKLAQRFSRGLRVFVDQNVGDEMTEAEKAYTSFVYRLGDRNKRVKMIKDAQALAFFNGNDLDAQSYLLNCRNVVLNLRTHEIMNHDPELLLSKVCNADFNLSASSEIWERFIADVMQNNTEKIDYLRRIFGYGLTGENPQEELYLCYGATTRNGKSTCLETVSNMLGGYAMNLDPASLALKPRDSRGASGDIARLKGCRFLHCSEPPKRMVLDVAMVKTLLGRDKITARNLYEREIEFTPVFKLFINSNYLPLVNDDTVFSSGRIKVIEFNRHFKPEEQDKSLKDRLSSPESLSGVLNWCLSGLSDYQEIGTLPPDPVRYATEAYRAQSNKIGNFIDECMEEASGHAIQAKIAYEFYQKWCRSNGYGCENKSNFFTELKNKNLLSETGTVNGATVKNVIKGYYISPGISAELDGISVY